MLIGWWIASIIAGLVATILRRIHFDEFADRSGITSFIRSMGQSVEAAGLFAGIVKWFIRLIVLIVAFDELGLAFGLGGRETAATIVRGWYESSRGLISTGRPAGNSREEPPPERPEEPRRIA